MRSVFEKVLFENSQNLIEGGVISWSSKFQPFEGLVFLLVLQKVIL